MSARQDEARLEASWSRSERMIGRWVAGEFVIVPLRDQAADIDSIYNLNGVAAFIWERLDGRTSGQAVVRALVERFEVEERIATADYVAFLEQLESIGAVILATDA